MNLGPLLLNSEFSSLVTLSKGDLDVSFRDFHFDSRKVKAGDLYVAITGVQNDGHRYLNEAVKAGATVLVVERENEIPTGFSGPVIVAKNCRDFLDELASYFYGKPSQDLICIGVTGTNGKTSTTYLVERMLDEVGVATGVLGTIDHHFK
ncbi:MAG: UDP-N-acetylmuramoyl-L-alanyl-D-glutamate--2,6-diaminopimelate ligase, partial [Bdellovibrionales bacterium]|nr:UDP-N-acetylmuramoyl-L-alanyl-D-glutamate--2,6-diaminopimelate ligase [Bdellovibrionales bacterium]